MSGIGEIMDEKEKKNIKPSMLNKAFELFETQKRPKSLTFRSIVNSVFKDTKQPSEEKIARFWADFMNSGLFVYCGDNSKGEQVWDLKARKSVAILDKSSYDLEYIDNSDDEQEALTNELKDGINEEDDILERARNYEESEDDTDDTDFDDEDVELDATGDDVNITLDDADFGEEDIEDTDE